MNGKTFTLEQPAVITQGRTMVPLRFVAESLGRKVEWNEKDRTITIE